MHDQTLGFGSEKMMDELGRNHSNHLHNKTILQKTKPVQGFLSSIFSKMKKISLVTKFRKLNHQSLQSYLIDVSLTKFKKVIYVISCLFHFNE